MIKDDLGSQYSQKITSPKSRGFDGGSFGAGRPILGAFEKHRKIDESSFTRIAECYTCRSSLCTYRGRCWSYVFNQMFLCFRDNKLCSLIVGSISKAHRSRQKKKQQRRILPNWRTGTAYKKWAFHLAGLLVRYTCTREGLTGVALYYNIYY